MTTKTLDTIANEIYDNLLLLEDMGYAIPSEVWQFVNDVDEDLLDSDDSDDYDDYDGNADFYDVDEATEWRDYDPDC